MIRNKLLIKTFGFLVVGIVIVFVFSITPGTYSWFMNSYEGPIPKVEAATSKDFIEEMEIYYDVDTPYIRLKKSNTIDYSPIIFFSVEGDLEDYILHIDSAKLEGVVDIPIVPNVNLPQAISLILSNNDEINGEIRVKHLNDFIDETLHVSISKEYLLERYFFHGGLDNFQRAHLSKGEKDAMVNFVEEMISYTSNYLDWDNVIWNENGYELHEYGLKDLPIGKAEMSNEQIRIIDIIAPNLLDYNDKLYSIMEILFNDVNNEIMRNRVLEEKNNELSINIEELELTIAQLKNEISSLERDNDALYDQIRDLEETIREKDDVIKIEPVEDNPEIDEVEQDEDEQDEERIENYIKD